MRALLLVCVSCLAMFGKFASEIVEGELAPWNQAIYVRVQAISAPWVHYLATAVTHTGDWAGYALACVTVAWVYRHHGWGRDLASLLLLLTGVPVLVVGFKLLYHMDRPLIDGLPAAAGFSFPSGHTLFATCLYGYLGARMIIRRRAWGILCFLWPLAVAWSRVELSRHWFSDVVGGLLLGTSWVTLCLAVRAPRR